ncbi:hypothetical protein G3I67_07340 [Orrella sp. NBD-18]|uniref:Uncharacterized protein n=1 Tax=Sheuella amnicola TaxID=2707330 RepID=A0A6B2QX77_9BURK|nr:hypothetical protein [Sheuella amnicola]NDY83040.1 hypothetical protein [Sheuella amnicola]
MSHIDRKYNTVLMMFYFSMRLVSSAHGALLAPFCVFLGLNLAIQAEVLAQVPGSLASQPVTITPDRPGLSVILPAQSFPVESETLANRAQEMALDPRDEDPLTGMVIEPEPQYQLDWQAGVDPLPAEYRVALTGMLGVGPAVRLNSSPRDAGWVNQAGSLKYQQDNGSAVVLGQITDSGGFWGNAPRLGGIQVTRLPNVSSRGTLMPGSFGMSAELGMTTQEDLGRIGTGGLTVGAPSGRGSVRFGLTPDVTIESRVRTGLEDHSVGLGGTMALSDWGLLRLNTTQTNPTSLTHAEDIASSSWRTGLGMQVNFDRHQLESSYETVRYNQSAIEQRLGVKHNWSVSPNLKMQFGAERELVSGGYSARVQMSVPLDAVVSKWWGN